MNPPNSTTAKSNLFHEISTRLMIGLFMFLCWRLAAFVLHPVEEGDLKLIYLSLIEISMMVVLALYSGTNNVTRDINELNCYALLTHLGYLPLFYLGVTSDYHNIGIRVILAIVVIRLIYFGPKTPDGDYKGVPMLGIIEQLRAWIGKHASEGNLAIKALPHVLFFGSAVPLWVIVGRSHDQAVTLTVIVLMVFIYCMSLQVKKLFSTMSAKAGPLVARAPIDNASAVIPTREESPEEQSARRLASSLLDAVHQTHPQARNILVAANWYFAKSFPRNPLVSAMTMSERRREWLNQIEELMALADGQHKLKDTLDDDDFLRFNGMFSKIFDHQLRDAELVKFINYVESFAYRELTDTSLLFACDGLIMSWLSLLLTDNDNYMARYAQLKSLSEKFVKQFRAANYAYSD